MTTTDTDVDPYRRRYDDDPFDTHKDTCACGHQRSTHWPSCTSTVTEPDYTALPKPQFPPREHDNPFAWPTNWPPANQIPNATTPCPCTRFGDPEPPEPDHY